MKAYWLRSNIPSWLEKIIIFLTPVAYKRQISLWQNNVLRNFESTLSATFMKAYWLRSNIPSWLEKIIIFLTPIAYKRQISV
jgi:hypothetical protein